jgi:hypothetical protein
VSARSPPTGPVWAVNFYKDNDCKEYLAAYLSDDIGSPQSCTTKGLGRGEGNSVEWVPGFNTRLTVSSITGCGSPANVFHADYQGCLPFTQNVNPAVSWKVEKV